MQRGEGATAFAVMAGAMFLVSVMGPLFVYGFRPSAHDPLLLAAVALLGLAQSASLYGISTILRFMGTAPASATEPAPSPADPRAELLGTAKPGGKAFSSPAELMSSVRTLIELENWKLAHQRASELVEAFPGSEEASKVKKNLDYLRKKAGGG